MKNLVSTLMYIHQFPQNLIGLILSFVYRGNILKYPVGVCEVDVIKSDKIKDSISLGKTVITYKRASMITVRHELGHCKQSQYLGWLYLLIIGLPSILWAFVYSKSEQIRKSRSYYSFYTEHWADKLGGVKRK